MDEMYICATLAAILAARFVLDAIRIHALLSAINNNDSSNIVHFPGGPNALSDVLMSTPIFTRDGEYESGFTVVVAATVVGDVTGFGFGVVIITQKVLFYSL